MATNANQLAKSGKFGDLRRRLVFLLLALVVYRIGAHIPVPGIDPDAAAGAVQGPAGRHPEPVQHVLGRRAVALHRVRAGHHAVHLGVDHHAADDLRGAHARGHQEGRRGGPAQDHAVHALRHAGAGDLPGAGHRAGARRLAGPGHRSGHGLSHDGGGQPGGRHDVPDVAGRADHRARPGQRHLDPDLRRHRRRPAERDRRPVRTGAHRCDEHRRQRCSSSSRRGAGHLRRRVRRARPAQDPGQLRQAPGRQQGLRRPVLAPAAEAEHVGRDPADLRLVDHPAAGDGRRLVRHRRRPALAEGLSAARCRRVSRSTCCCTRR